MPLRLPPKPAFNLHLRGSRGVFCAKGPRGASVRVETFQTHMKLSFLLDDDERLLRALAPVREVFNLKDLDFEQLMQRDIDDARVATELIPYLLGGEQVRPRQALPADHRRRAARERSEAPRRALPHRADRRRGRRRRQHLAHLTLGRGRR
jgi:hypothetical protein